MICTSCNYAVDLHSHNITYCSLSDDIIEMQNLKYFLNNPYGERFSVFNICSLRNLRLYTIGITI